MSLFTSSRERRLWLWTLAVMVAIYSTLGPARTLVDALRDRNLLRLSFALVVALLVGTIAWRMVKRRPGRSEIGVALGAAFAYLWAFLRIASPEERTHLIEYGIVAALIHQALIERERNGQGVPVPAALAVVVTAILGLADECIQAVLPNRVFDVRDIAFNALAGFMVIVARLALLPVVRPGWRVWFLWLVACSAGWGVGMEAGSFVEPGGVRTLFSSTTPATAAYLSLAVGCLLVGTLQWLVLRGHLSQAGLWVLANLGAVAALGIVVVVVGAVWPESGWIVGAVLFGLLLGCMQWLVLRRRLGGTGWWVLASAVSWAVGVFAGQTVGWIGLGAVHGVVTGALLVLLLRITEKRNE